MQDDKVMTVDFDGEMIANASSAFQAMACLGSLDRIKSGELSDTDDFSPPISLVERLTDLIKARQKTLNEKIHWFTFRRDEFNQCFHSWPVAGYRYGLSYEQIVHEAGVVPALKRLANRACIVDIKVSAPVPKNWYFGTIEELST